MVKLERVLLPTDFSESARHAFTYALSLAQKYDAALHLLHVIEVLPSGYTSELFPGAMTRVVEEISGYARAEMAKLVQEATGQGRPPRELIVQGKPAAEILRVAAEDTVDIIVIGSHGRGALSHALFGSTTERVVRKAPCPVLICRRASHEPVSD
jgi:nucleotide-binding universal stress UspA family protein